jgi:hypothetical protein
LAAKVPADKAPVAVPGVTGAAKAKGAHVIFCIDNSGSMKTNDAKLSNGVETRRCDVVYECCQNFLKQQLEAGGANQVYSLLLFDDAVEQRFTGVPLSEALSALEKEKHLKPHHGTNYAAAWANIEAIVTARPSEQNWVVFLSDGRPAELRLQIPELGAEQTTVRVNKKTFDSAPTIVRRLATKLASEFSVHAVAIGDEDSGWLKRLADVAAFAGAKTGAYWRPAGLSLQVSEPSTAAASMAAANGAVSLSDGARVFKVPPPRGASSAAARSQSSASTARTLGETFNRISSALTSSMGPAAARPERPVTFEDPGAWMQRSKGEAKHRAGVFLPDTCTWQDLEIRVRQNPFAKGGQRNAYHLFYGNKWFGEKHMVAKENRRQEAYKDRLATHKLEIGASEYARSLVPTFNAKLAAAVKGNSIAPHRGTAAPPAIEVLPVKVMRFCSSVIGSVADEMFSSLDQIDSSTTGYRYMAVEPFLEGEFQKFNGNNGFVRKKCSSLTGCEYRRHITLMGCSYISEELYADDLPHAFTHWTYEHTLATAPDGEEAMVCDIQGVGVKYTDVTVHTQGRKFGSTDLGQKGFEHFFATHRCNGCCEMLGLSKIVGPEADASESRRAATATSAIEMMRTKHLERRKAKRGIDTRSMQAAIKHGTKTPGNRPDTVKHALNGVCVVTAGKKGDMVGITTYEAPVGRGGAPLVPRFT